MCCLCDVTRRVQKKLKATFATVDVLAEVYDKERQEQSRGSVTSTTTNESNKRLCELEIRFEGAEVSIHVLFSKAGALTHTCLRRPRTGPHSSRNIRSL